MTAVSVLVPVALSGLVLVVLAPGLWWIFTTYGWVAFPAFRLLASGLLEVREAGTSRVPAPTKERELLVALRRHGELTPALAAVETSLSVTEADNIFRELAEGGHLEVRVRGGGIFYSLWRREPEDYPAGPLSGPEISERG